MTAEPTERDLEAALEYTVPDAGQLARLLEWFFVGPIDAATVSRLDNELRALLANADKKSVTADAFVGNSRKYIGQAWKELLSNHRQRPTPSELAIWLAVTTKGYPPPRPYCPAALVGTWRQVKPSPATWRFDADGTVQTDDPPHANRNRWCVHHKNPEKPLWESAELMFVGDLAFVPTRLVIREVTPQVIRGYRLGPDDAIEYTLERA